ncbi:MAG: hypothetical protein K0S51_2163 [Bacillales bacterium]|jgi:hypothetical protein|nr:hypothetical protein [Bacillales bacterium]
MGSNQDQKPETYINIGYISLKDDVAFRTTMDVCNCFGHNYTGWQRGAAKHPHETDTELWFPKLFPNDLWDNKISEDGCTIYERHIDPSENQHYLKGIIAGKLGNNIRPHKGIVFAKVRGPLGDVMHRFKGLFQLNIEKSLNDNSVIWNKISDTVKTYRSKY